MRLLLAIFLPWLAFFTLGRPLAGIVCLILQLTLMEAAKLAETAAQGQRSARAATAVTVEVVQRQQLYLDVLRGYEPVQGAHDD